MKGIYSQPGRDPNRLGNGKLFIYLIVLLGVVSVIYQFIREYNSGSDQLLHRDRLRIESIPSSKDAYEHAGDSMMVDLPSMTKDHEYVHHHYFDLSYSEKHEEAEWVAYVITRDRLNGPKQHRYDYFDVDPNIPGGSAQHHDYSGSGYTRGHLAAAADMAFDPIAEQECFYMSNMTPQVKQFNDGIWRELEEDVRDWGRRFKKVYIVTGPVLTTGIIGRIGKTSKVSVPSLYYKVILDADQPELKGIGFIIPNALSDLPLGNFMVSIDSIEHLTGIDFFNGKSKNSIIEELESRVDPLLWPINEQRFMKRVNEWNKKE